MHHRMSAGNMLWIILLLFVATFGFNACSDTNNVSGPPAPVPLSPDAELSTLTVNPGTLDPAFSGDVANYTVDVSTNIASVTVTATPQNASATMTINGQTTASGQARTITLGGPSSSTPIPVVVTAVNGSQNTYLVTVNRAALSGNNSLQSLTVSPGTLAPAFNANTLNYSVDVASGVSSVTVTATLQDANASMEVNGQGTSSGQARPITLGGSGSSTPITIEVTAPNGSQKTYTVTVNRAALGGNNDLSALSVTGQTLVPGFSSGQITYTVNVASGVTSVTVSATKSDPNAVMSGSLTAGVGDATGQATIPLPGGPSSTPVSIIVTAPNGSQKTYTITVNRAAPANTNNNLSALVVSAGALTPSFASGILIYNVNNVPNTTTNTMVTATVADSTATLTINGSAAISGAAFGPIALVVGANPIPIVVTAQDGTPKTYTVTVNRAAPLSSNNDLSALAVSAGALVPDFNAAITNYNVSTSILTTTSTTVTATVADSTATLTINGSPATSGVPSASIPLVLGPNPISIDATAEDGTPKTYTVTITLSLL